MIKNSLSSFPEEDRLELERARDDDLRARFEALHDGDLLAVGGAGDDLSPLELLGTGLDEDEPAVVVGQEGGLGDEDGLLFPLEAKRDVDVHARLEQAVGVPGAGQKLDGPALGIDE